jgi:uncharacterized protein
MVTQFPLYRARRVFHDSSSFAALLDRTDTNHQQAATIVGNIADAHYRPVTTNVIIIEAHTLILSELGNRNANQFLRDIRRSHMLIVRVRAQDEERAQDILFRYTDKKWSFADATSFVVMERLGIRYAFNFDHDFEQYGFTVLTPDLRLP